MSQTTPLRLDLPSIKRGYADAQIDDYGFVAPAGQFRSRRNYPWRPGVSLRLRARFSHQATDLMGTAGFGFWNAPFGDPTVRWPALPQATWFFYASAPSDLPLAKSGPGRGWFAATIDASRRSALAVAPLAPAVLLLNQISGLRHRIWPAIRRQLGISFAPIAGDMRQAHDYELHWLPDGCYFNVDGQPVLQTPHSPRGPLGFVCWLDNQYLLLTNRGRFRWGVLPTSQDQWLEIAALEIREISSSG